MMPTGSQQRRSARLLYRWCLVDGNLDQFRVREAVRHVLQLKRRGYAALLGEFKRLVRLQLAERNAKVESAVPLQADLQTRLRQNLEIAYGQGLTTQFDLNPELIGGIRIRVANDVYDSTVKAKLSVLAKSFGIPSERMAAG